MDTRTQLSNPIHHQALLHIIKCKEVGIFKRALVNQITVIHSLSHTQPQKRNSYIVSYHHQGKFSHGEILYFVTDYSQGYAVILSFTNPLLMLPSDSITMCPVPHIHIYSSKSESSVHVVPVSHINICISVTFNQAPSTFLSLNSPTLLKKTKNLLHVCNYIIYMCVYTYM